MRGERPMPEWFTIDTIEPGMGVTSTYIVFTEGFPEELQIEGNIGIQAITSILNQ